MTAAAVKAWPPRWLTPVSKDELRWGDGAEATRFIEGFCSITEDSLAGRVGERLKLRPWQRSLVSHVLARRSKFGALKHRRGLIGIARKNGKTTLAAGLGLYGLLSDYPGGVQGREVYACAGDKEQAKLIFGTAQQMIEAHPALADATRLYRDAIEVPATHSIFRVLSAEAYTKEGLNPTLVLFDEVHVQPNRELWDVMALAFGARADPLMLGITTAGVRYDATGNDSIAFQLYEYGRKVANGEIIDPEFLFAWWEPREADASHLVERTWREGNPGFGDICNASDFVTSSRTTPETEFRTKRCNQWAASKSAFLPAGAWDKVARTSSPRIADGAPVVIAFDGSYNQDSTAVVAIEVSAKPHIEVVESWEKDETTDPSWRVPVVDVENVLRATCGRIDSSVPMEVRERLERIVARKWKVRELSCDKFRWERTFQILEDEGLPVIEFPQTATFMSPATQRFYEAIVNHQMTHDGDPRLARHVDNAVLRRDSRGVRITKENPQSTRHIDLAVAALMGHSRACWHFANPPEPEAGFNYALR